MLEEAGTIFWKTEIWGDGGFTGRMTNGWAGGDGGGFADRTNGWVEGDVGFAGRPTMDGLRALCW
jgi:hypothetical protein